jgi:ribosome-interacting GTPase 1
MPTNLPPDYYEVDKRFRAAESPAEKVALLEEMISIVPKHKGTDKLRADLRRQLSKLKVEAQSRKKHGTHTSAFHIDREGAGQVVVIGTTNVGKSSMIAELTNADPEVSAAPFTTWKPTPGMMPVENIQVQLIDTPPLNPEFVEPGLFDLIRRADIVLLMVDLQADPLQQLEDTLAILEEHRIAPIHRESAYPENARMTFVDIVLLVNKCDPGEEELYELCCELLEEDWVMLPVSVTTGRNIQAFKDLLYERLDIIRVYAKPPGEEPDLQRPFVLKYGSTVIDLAGKIHRDFYDNLKSARVWGSTMFEGQMVQRDYVLQDGDIVEFKIT